MLRNLPNLIENLGGQRGHVLGANAEAERE
jgi:hypothetical protein